MHYLKKHSSLHKKGKELLGENKKIWKLPSSLYHPEDMMLRKFLMGNKEFCNAGRKLKVIFPPLILCKNTHSVFLAGKWFNIMFLPSSYQLVSYLPMYLLNTSPVEVQFLEDRALFCFHIYP